MSHQCRELEYNNRFPTTMSSLEHKSLIWNGVSTCQVSTCLKYVKLLLSATWRLKKKVTSSYTRQYTLECNWTCLGSSQWSLTLWIFLELDESKNACLTKTKLGKQVPWAWGVFQDEFVQYPASKPVCISPSTRKGPKSSHWMHSLTSMNIRYLYFVIQDQGFAIPYCLLPCLSLCTPPTNETNQYVYQAMRWGGKGKGL